MASIIIHDVAGPSILVTEVRQSVVLGAPENRSVIIHAPAADPGFPLVITGTGGPPDPTGIPENSIYIEYS